MSGQVHSLVQIMGGDFFIRVCALAKREVRATGGMIKDLLYVIRHNVKLLQNII
jgi:hypothetical protein